MKINKPDTDLQMRLVERLDGIGWHGHYVTAICPFHTSFPVRPSLFVYPDAFWCASCGKSGPLPYLEHLLSNSKVKYREEGSEPVNELPDWGKFLKEYGSFDKAAIQAYRTAKEFPVLVDYLRARGLNIFFDSKLGYIDGWLSFPVFDWDGNFVDWVLRATPAKNTTAKYVTRPRKFRGESHALYAANWESIEAASGVFVPFGILDMWTLHSCGFPALTGLTGKSYRPEWFEKLRKKIYLIPDRGEEVDAHKFAVKLGWRGKVLHLDYPDDCKDSNDILRNYGMDRVILTVNNALRRK